MKVDYLIIGAGIAGLSFARECQLQNKSFLIIDNQKRTSSKIAGGMFNPVVLKRFTSIWESKSQLDIAYEFYPLIEKELGMVFFHKMSIFRKFASIEEQNNWFLAADHPSTSEFINPKIRFDQFHEINSEYGFGEVFDTGYLDVGGYVQAYQKWLLDLNLLKYKEFNYDDVVHSSEYVIWKDIKAQSLVFAEGFSMIHNPFFNYLPLDGTKGELLYVKIPNLKLNEIVKSGVFIIPVGNDIYKVGATYNWQDKSDIKTEDAREELINGLKSITNCSFEIVEHFAGIRPTVKDRRPLIGRHYLHEHIYLLNGLGTRGVLLGPYLAKKLFAFIEDDVALDPNVDVKRYYKKLQLIK